MQRRLDAMDNDAVASMAGQLGRLLFQEEPETPQKKMDELVDINWVDDVVDQPALVTPNDQWIPPPPPDYVMEMMSSASRRQSPIVHPKIPRYPPPMLKPTPHDWSMSPNQGSKEDLSTNGRVMSSYGDEYADIAPSSIASTPSPVVASPKPPTAPPPFMRNKSVSSSETKVKKHRQHNNACQKLELAGQSAFGVKIVEDTVSVAVMSEATMAASRRPLAFNNPCDVEQLPVQTPIKEKWQEPSFSYRPVAHVQGVGRGLNAQQPRRIRPLNSVGFKAPTVSTSAFHTPAQEHRSTRNVGIAFGHVENCPRSLQWPSRAHNSASEVFCPACLSFGRDDDDDLYDSHRVEAARKKK